MFPPLHKSLVDDLASIVLACRDVNRLLDDRVRPTPECLSCPILKSVSNLTWYRACRPTWQGTVEGILSFLGGKGGGGAGLMDGR